MANPRRQLRVEGELQQLIADYIIRGFKYPLKGLVSVTRIETSEKITTAKIYVTVMGSPEDLAYSLETLQDHVHDIQKHVQRNLRMKYIPRLSVHEDVGFYKMLDMENKFRQIAEERKKISKSNDSGEDE